MPFEQLERSQQQFAPQQKCAYEKIKKEKSAAFLCMHFFNCLQLSIQLAQHTRDFEQGLSDFLRNTRASRLLFNPSQILHAEPSDGDNYTSFKPCHRVCPSTELSIFSQKCLLLIDTSVNHFPFSCESNIIVWALLISLPLFSCITIDSFEVF